MIIKKKHLDNCCPEPLQRLLDKSPENTTGIRQKYVKHKYSERPSPTCWENNEGFNAHNRCVVLWLIDTCMHGKFSLVLEIVSDKVGVPPFDSCLLFIYCGGSLFPGLIRAFGRKTRAENKPVDWNYNRNQGIMTYVLSGDPG